MRAGMLRILLFVLLVATYRCQAPIEKPVEQPSPYQDPEAYQVYSAIIPLEWPSRVANARALVISGKTARFDMCLHPDEGSDKIIGAAIEDYVRLTKQSWQLESRFSLKTPYELVTPSDLESIIEGGGWEYFYKVHPDSGGYIELSPVGFNAAKTVAVVYTGHACGNLCGGGGFQVLEKMDGEWKPLKWNGSACAWAS